jgi:hypothetical protein
MPGTTPRKPICWKSSVFVSWCALLASVVADVSGASAEEALSPPVRDCMESQECVDLVQSARRLSESNQLNAALQTYESALAQWQSPWLLINIGRIHQKLGRPAEAITAYHTYFDRAENDSPQRIKAARGFLKQAESDLAESRAPRSTDKPVHKKWWLWTAIGGTVVLATAITTGAVIGTRSSSEVRLPANTLMFPLMVPF